MGTRCFGDSMLWGQYDFGDNELWGQRDLGTMCFGDGRLWEQCALRTVCFGDCVLWGQRVGRVAVLAGQCSSGGEGKQRTITKLRLMGSFQM